MAIRFIVKRTTRYSGYVSSDLETVDADCPELENVLRRGGYGAGPNGDDFDRTELIGAVTHMPNMSVCPICGTDKRCPVVAAPA